jgi:hypothetical protein
MKLISVVKPHNGQVIASGVVKSETWLNLLIAEFDLTGAGTKRTESNGKTRMYCSAKHLYVDVAEVTSLEDVREALL